MQLSKSKNSFAFLLKSQYLNTRKYIKVYGDKMVGNKTVEKRSDLAWNFAKAVKAVWDKGENVEENAKKFEEFLKILRELAKELDNPEFKELSDMSKALADISAILEDAYELSKLLKAKDLFQGFLNMQRKDESE